MLALEVTRVAAVRGVKDHYVVLHTIKGSRSADTVHNDLNILFPAGLRCMPRCLLSHVQAIPPRRQHMRFTHTHRTTCSLTNDGRTRPLNRTHTRPQPRRRKRRS